MEIRIKTGDDLVCEYTKLPSSVLVKIKPNDEGEESLWLGRKALEEALSVVATMDKGPKVQVNGSFIGTQQFEAQPVPASAPIHSMHVFAPPPPAPVQAPPVLQTPVDSPQIVRQFEKELQHIIANPGTDDDGNPKEGVSEAAVKKLIFRYKSTFNDPIRGMFPIINRLTGMPKQRFELILRTKPLMSEMMEDDDD